MTRTSAKVVLWGPRVLGLLMSVFLSLFALDAFSEGKPLMEALPAFAVHVAPAVCLLIIVGLSWRWEWLGGVAFIGLSVAYATMMAHGRLDWMLLISAPLVVIGSLFLLSWRHHEELRAIR